jgi:hypothetical protein
MTPSVSLPYGFVFVYGTGTDIGLAGNYATDTVFKFGTIYGVGVNMGSEIIGNSIALTEKGSLPISMGKLPLFSSKL